MIGKDILYFLILFIPLIYLEHYLFLKGKSVKDILEFEKETIITFIAITWCFVMLNNNSGIIKILHGTAVWVFVGFIAILLFSLNLNENKIFGKSFSFYYTKYNKNIYKLVLPFVVVEITSFCIENIVLSEINYIIWISLIYFYLYKSIEALKLSFNWYIGHKALDFEKIYIELFKNIEDDKGENGEIDLSIYTILEENFQKNKEIYKEIYLERIKSMKRFRKYDVDIKFDDFTFRLIQLSMKNNKENKIDFLESENEYDKNIFKKFFEILKKDQKFLIMLLERKNLEIGNFNSKVSLEILLKAYTHYHIEEIFEIDLTLSEILVERSEEFTKIEILKIIFLELYLSGKIELIKRYLRYNKSLSLSLIVESIFQTHNELIKKDGIREVHNKITGLIEYDPNQYPDEIRELVQMDYSSFKNEITEYGKIFVDIEYSVFSNFEFDGAITTNYKTENNSEIILSIKEVYEERFYNKISKNYSSEEFNNYLYFVNDFYQQSNQNLQEKVCKFIISKKDNLFSKERKYEEVDFLLKYYDVINGLLNDEVRSEIKQCLTEDGEYDIPIIKDLSENNSVDENIEIITKFYDKYKNQFYDKEKTYFHFFDNDAIVRNKTINKVNLSKLLIKHMIKDENIQDTNLYESLREYPFFQEAIGIMYFYGPEEYQAIVDKENIDFLKGLQKVLKTINKNSKNGIYTYGEGNKEKTLNVSDSIGKYRNLFENKEIVSKLQVDELDAIDFLEDIGIPFKFKNVDEDFVESLKLFLTFHLKRMSEPINFLKEFIDSEYFTSGEFDNCNALFQIYNYFLQDTEDINEVEELIIEMIEKINKSRVSNGYYNAVNINEFESIKKLLRVNKNENIREKIEEEIIKYIESYLLT